MPDDKMKLLNDCKDQEKATDDDVQMFLSQKKPQTKGGKCLIACIYEKKGGVSNYSFIFAKIALFLATPISISLLLHRLKMGKLMQMLLKQP